MIWRSCFMFRKKRFLLAGIGDSKPAIMQEALAL
jgi:hypothetical protein